MSPRVSMLGRVVRVNIGSDCSFSGRFFRLGVALLVKAGTEFGTRSGPAFYKAGYRLIPLAFLFALTLRGAEVTLGIRAEDTLPRPVQTILEAQVELHRRGFSCGAIDGVAGAQTEAALRALQRGIG